MVNYYVELNLDRSLDIPQLEKELKALKRKWTTRASSASSTEKRQEAERMVALIREASATLLNKDNKAKYDKQLDKDPGASSQTAPTVVETEHSAPSYSGSADLEELMEEFYNSGNYNQALSVANKAFRAGTATVEIYRLAALCHAEQGDNGSSFRVLTNMMKDFPKDDDASLVYALFCIRLLPEHAAEGHKMVQALLEAGYDESNFISALDVEYSLMCGDVELAERKIQTHIDKYGKDRSFCKEVAGAFARYADSFLTSYGGDMYLDSQEACDNWFKYMNRSLELDENADVRKLLNDNQAIVGGKTFLTDNWLGVACAVLYTFAGFGTNFFIGLLFLALTAAEVYFSIVPKWMLHRYNYTNHLVGIYEVFRIINVVLALLVRVGWEITKFIFRLIFAFV